MEGYTANLTPGGANTAYTKRKVEHHSLTDPERKVLESHLLPFLQGKNTDKKALAAIFKNPDIFPQRIRRSLEALVDEKDTSVVFILHNLPEIDPGKLPEQLPGETEWKHWVVKNSYASSIMEGVYLSLGITPNTRGATPIIRYPNEVKFAGRLIHRDFPLVAGLGVMKTDGSITRFIDFEGVLRDLNADSDLRNIRLKIKNRIMTVTDCVNNDLFKKEKSFYIEIVPDETNARVEAFNHAVDRHSLSVRLGPGEVAFWRNNGAILHQAMPSPGGHSNEIQITDGQIIMPSRLATVLTGDTGQKTLAI